MITSLGPGEFPAGLGLSDGDAAIVGLDGGEDDGGGDGLVGTGRRVVRTCGMLEVGEETEPTGLA